MRINTFLRVVAGAVAAGVLLVGCGTNSGAEAAVGGDISPSAGGVDRAALGTGDFQTFPQPSYGTADPEKAIWIESQRLAEFVVMPFEVDPELTESFGSTKPVTEGSDLESRFSKAGAAIAAESLVAGYMNGAKAPEGEREFSQTVLRLADNAAASSAAERIHNSLVTTDNNGIGIQKAEAIDVLPNTLVSSKEVVDPSTSKPSVSIDAFTAHGNYLLHSSAWVSVTDREWVARAIATSLELQVPLIDQFPATPVDSMNDIKIDQDDVLIYAIGRTRGALASSEEAVYGPRGYAQELDDRFPDASRLYALLNETGTDRIAVFSSNVFRSDSLASAQKLLDGFTAAAREAGWVDAPSPKGLPNAACMTSESGGSNTCWVVNGRFVGRSIEGTKEAVDQQISAQYLILEKAE